MKQYHLKIHPEALNDIQYATDWYNDKVKGLGTRFQKQVISQINKLKNTGEIYDIRYKDVRCMVVKKFPFMVHFTIDTQEGILTVYAVFHTSRNPRIWENRFK